MKMAYIYLIITVILTVFGQLAFKYGVNQRGDVPHEIIDKIWFIAKSFGNIWIILSCFSTALAAVSWLLTLTKLDLNHAYPFLSLTFILVLFLSGYFFEEPITIYKIIGAVLVITGIAVSVYK
jgi:multidrug transporter EmrE-like cation transporter